MKDRTHYLDMLERNGGATIGYTLAARMVVSLPGVELPHDHWKVRDTARWLRGRYGEVLTADEVRREMGEHDGQAQAAGGEQFDNRIDGGGADCS